MTSFRIMLLLIVLCSSLLSMQSTSAEEAIQELPNIIVIYTDDQGYGDASCLNPKAKFQTPNLDRLAREGISFTNAHSGDTVCTPSRYALLTGRYCWRTDRKTGVMGAEGNCLITDDRMTLASMLKGRGYQTAMVGKWHLGMQFSGEIESRDWTKPVQDMPLDKGFDYFYGIPASLNFGVLAWFEGRYAKVPPTLYTGKKPNERHVDYRIMPPFEMTWQEAKQTFGRTAIEIAPDFVDQECLTRFVDRSLSWMQQATEQEDAPPFFLYLPLTSPHYPVCPLPQFHGQGECGGYGEFMIETDYHVGRILEYLDQSGLAENTLIVLTSDNGPENSWKQRIPEFGHASNGGYRGGKRDIYEGGHRVPFFVRWPQGIAKPGRSSDRLIGQVDLLATLAELVDAPVPDNAAEDSESFLGLLTSIEKISERSPLINHGIKGRFAITHGTWKLIFSHGKEKLELYDLANDPQETINVVKEHPDLASELTKKATDIVVQGRTTPGKPQSNDTDYWKDLTWIAQKEYEQ